MRRSEALFWLGCLAGVIAIVVSVDAAGQMMGQGVSLRRNGVVTIDAWQQPVDPLVVEPAPVEGAAPRMPSPMMQAPTKIILSDSVSGNALICREYIERTDCRTIDSVFTYEGVLEHAAAYFEKSSGQNDEARAKTKAIVKTLRDIVKQGVK